MFTEANVIESNRITHARIQEVLTPTPGRKKKNGRPGKPALSVS